MADKQPDSKTLKMVLLGKTGAGKSASGNTILGEEHFEVRCSSSSVTTRCSEETRILGEQELIVVDTPGLFNTKCEQKEMMRELVNFLQSVVTEQMPDAFLWVIECGSFTEEVTKSIEIFKEVFESVTEHTIVLFTNGNEEKVKAFIKDNKGLNDFINECNNVYQVFDNKNKDKNQVLELVEKINNLVKKNRKPFSSSLLEKAKRAIEELKNQPEALTAGSPEDLLWFVLDKCINLGVDYVNKQCSTVKEFLKSLDEVLMKFC